MEWTQWTSAAPPGAVCGQTLNLNRSCIQRRTVNGHNVIPTARVLQESFSQGTALTDEPERTTGSLDEENILLVEGRKNASAWHRVMAQHSPT